MGKEQADLGNKRDGALSKLNMKCYYEGGRRYSDEREVCRVVSELEVGEEEGQQDPVVAVLRGPAWRQQIQESQQCRLTGSCRSSPNQ